MEVSSSILSNFSGASRFARSPIELLMSTRVLCHQVLLGVRVQVPEPVGASLL